MANILIIYSTTDGHTLKICERLRQIIEKYSHRVVLCSIKDWRRTDLSAFDKIVIGASIRYGKHSPLVADFIRRNQTLLDGRPNAFFSVNVVARKPEKSRPDTNPYLLKFLRGISWKPRQLAVFAGKIDFPRYNPVDRMMIRFIMWLTKGQTQRDAVVEFTDWHQVESFAVIVAEM